VIVSLQILVRSDELTEAGVSPDAPEVVVTVAESLLPHDISPKLKITANKTAAFVFMHSSYASSTLVLFQ
jgi:hypothetical protein